MSKVAEGRSVDQEQKSKPGVAESRQAVGQAPGRLASLGLGRFSGVIAFVVIFGLFSLWVPDAFLTATTWKTVLDTHAITAILAIGLLIPSAAGVFDLSLAQNAGFSALICGVVLMKTDLGVVPAVLAAVAVSTLVGLFNGYLVGVLGLDSFIATLGTLALLQGSAQFIANGEYLGPFPDEFSAITGGSLFGVPIVAVYMLVFAVLVWYGLEHTPVGRRFFATGANPDAARLAGIQTKRVVFASMVISGFVAGLAGILLASALNTVNEQLGPQYLLPAFAAAFLGTTQFKLGRFNVWGTVLAVYLLGMGVQGLQLAGADVWVTNVFNGAALILAVLYARALKNRRKKREVEAAEAEFA